MRILTIATDSNLPTFLQKYGDLIRTILGIVGTVLIALGVIDATPEEVSQVSDKVFVLVGGFLDLVALVSSWFSKKD